MILSGGCECVVGVRAQGSNGLSDRATFLNLALYLAMALGMQLMTFEDMTYELRRDQSPAGDGAGRAAASWSPPMR